MKLAYVVSSLVVASAVHVSAARAESPPPGRTWSIRIEACQAAPTTSSTGSGSGLISISFNPGPMMYGLAISGLVGGETEAHIHGPAGRGVNGPVLYTLPLGGSKNGTIDLPSEHQNYLLAGELYVDIHTTAFPEGELRGQIDDVGSACPPPIDAGIIDAPSATGTPDAGEGNGGGDGGGCSAGGSPASLAAVALMLIGLRRRRLTRR